MINETAIHKSVPAFLISVARLSDNTIDTSGHDDASSSGAKDDDDDYDLEDDDNDLLDAESSAELAKQRKLLASVA